MSLSVKPILSLDRLILTDDKLSDLGIEIDDSVTSIVVNNYRYNKTSYGFFIGLSEDELCISSPTDINLSTSLHEQFDGIWFNAIGNIFQYRDGELVQLLTSFNSKLRDFIEFKQQLVSVANSKLILEYLGADDLINSFVTDNKIISIFPDTNSVKVQYGNKYLDRDNCKVTYTDETSTEYVLVENVPEGTLDPYVYYLHYPKVIENNIGDISNDKLSSINKLIDTNESTLGSVVRELDDLINLVDRNLSDITSTDSLSLVGEGNISDYVSLKTLVSISTVKDAIVPLDLSVKMKNRIKRDNIDITYTKKGDSSYLKDPYVYMFEFQEYQVIDRLVSDGDLLELSILFKELGDVRTNITFEGDIMRCDNVPEDTTDPYIYWTELSQLCKLNTKDGDVLTPITYNGYHITFGNIHESSLVSRFIVKDSFIKLNDYFYVQVTSDTINLFTLSPSITEYYIKSCKLIKTS